MTVCARHERDLVVSAYELIDCPRRAFLLPGTLIQGNHTDASAGGFARICRETCIKKAVAFKSLWIRQGDAKLRKARHEDTFVAVRPPAVSLSIPTFLIAISATTTDLSPSSYPLYQSIPVARSAMIAGSRAPAFPYASRAEASTGRVRPGAVTASRWHGLHAALLKLGPGCRTRPTSPSRYYSLRVILSRRVRTAHRPKWGAPSLSVERLVKHGPCGIEALHMSPSATSRQWPSNASDWCMPEEGWAIKPRRECRRGLAISRLNDDGNVVC